jgi:tripartite ATP-independent transporter DctP family solute receptor
MRTSQIIKPSRRKMLKLSLGAAAAGIIGMPSVVQAQRARTLRFGSPVPVGSTYYKAQEVFADEVASLSGGRLKVELFPSFQLGSIKDMLTATQLGTQSIGMAVPAWFSGYAKPIDVFSMPFIVSSPERLRAALDGPFGQKTMALTEPAGFKTLGHWIMGPRQIVNNVRPIKKPEDLAGLKIRVITSPVFIETFKALGANPVGLDAAEMYLALQQKTVDGVDNAAVDLVNLKLFEVTKFLSITSHITDFFIVAMNKALWDGFAAEEQGMFKAAMKKSMDWEWTAQPEAIKAATDKLQSVMQMNEITPADREAFVKATRPVYQQFEASIGKDVIEQAIKEMGPIV